MKIKVSKLAAFKIETLLKYLEAQWSIDSSNIFLNKLNERINVIKINPKAFSQSTSRPELRKAVITRHSTLLYQIQKNHIYIVTLLDTRQDAAKIEKEIKKHFGSM